MSGKRIRRYLVLIFATIVAGLLSRHFACIPLFIGDVLWATMIYFIARFLFFAKKVKWAVLASLVFCFAIEFSQLYKAPWIDHLRHTLPGRLILGETFLWGDLVSYAAGILFGVLLERLISRTSF